MMKPINLRPICDEWIHSTAPADQLCPKCGCLHGQDKDNQNWQARERLLQERALNKLMKGGR